MKKLLRWSMLVFCLACGGAKAAILQVSGGQLTGATGVNVGGTLYNVQFLDGSCQQVFGGCLAQSFDFQSQATATLAAQSLVDQVFLNTAQGQFDALPQLTAGCESSIRCGIATPYGIGPLLNNQPGIQVANAFNFSSSSNVPDQTAGSNVVPFDLANNQDLVWAKWSASGGGNPCRSTDRRFFDRATSLSPSGAEMFASFSPSLILRGCTLDDVARAYGYDHFNWVQTITHYDGLLISAQGFTISNNVPLLDPPKGGYLPLHFADSLPYYWDETTSPLLDPDYYLYNNSYTYNLNFMDRPRSGQIDQPGEYMGFITSLVGVRGGDNWVPLTTFSWKSNYNGDSGGIFDTTRDLSPIVGGTGGIFDVTLLSDPWDVAPEVRDLWIANGASVPVPSTLWLLALGFFAMSAIRTSRRVPPA